MLKVVNLQKSYVTKTKERWQALKGVSLEFPNKGFIFIVGKSGSGKSTLLNIIGGLDSYDSGEIIIRGKSSGTFKAADFDSYRNTYIGFVFQEFNLLEEYSLAKNVQLALELQSFKGDMNAKVDEILDQVELKDKKNNKINEISGGQKQRVAIARALVKNPEIIIADEPTGNLDSETGRSVMDTLKKLSKEKLVIMVTHDIDYAAEYADRVIELKDGVVIKDETKSTSSSSVAVQYFDKPSSDVEKVIYIPKNKKVDNSFVEKINSLIAANPSEDLYIAISSKDKVIEQLAPKISSKIEKAGEGTVVALDYSPVSDFKLVKSKLPFFDSLKMAFKSIFIKKVRLFFTVLLMTVAFIFFGQSETIRTISFSQSLASTYNEFGIDTLSIEAKYGKEYSYEDIDNIEYNNIKRKFPNATYGATHTQTYEYMPINKNLQFTDYPIEHPKHAALRSVSLTDMPYSAYSSEMLVEDKSTAELNNSGYISSILADSLIEANANLNDYRSLLNQEIFIGVPIAGVYQFKKSKFFIKMEKLVDKYYDPQNNEINHEDMTTIERDNLERMWLPTKASYTNVHVKRTFNYTEHGLYDLKNSSSINNKNINKYYLPNRYDKYVDFAKNYSGERTKNDVVVDMSAMQIIDPTFDINTFDNPVTGVDLKWTASDPEVRIVGVLKSDFGTFVKSANRAYYNYGKVEEIINKDVYQLKNLFNDAWRFKLNARIINNQSTRKLLQYFFDNNYIYNQEVASQISSAVEVISIMEKVFFYASLVTLLFSIFLLFNGISASVLSKKKEIGTLRAIGARGWDVAKIFILEALMISLFVAILASLSVFGISAMLNGLFISKLSIAGIITIKWYIVAELIGAALVSSFIAAFLPAKRVSIMRPIDAIKNK